MLAKTTGWIRFRVQGSGLRDANLAKELIIAQHSLTPPLLPPSCRLWRMAWPLCWMEVLAFAKELIITSYVGHLGAAELSALVLAQTVYNVTGNAP